MSRREKLMHPATFISLVALFVALGGVGYAATRIGTKQLKNRAVTNKKLANNSVTSRKIRNGGVGSLDLADGSVFGAKLQDGAVGIAKLGDGAVTSGKLAAGSVTSGKLAAGSVTSGAIAPNSVSAGQIVDGQVVEGDGRLQRAVVTVPSGGGVAILSFPGIGGFSADCNAGQSTTHFANTGTADIQVTKFGADAGGAFDGASTVQAPGGALDQVSGTDGVSGATWLATSTDGTALVRIDAATHEHANGTDCLVTAVAISTG
jgi:hypothetical protein